MINYWRIYQKLRASDRSMIGIIMLGLMAEESEVEVKDHVSIQNLLTAKGVDHRRKIFAFKVPKEGIVKVGILVS